MSSLDQIHALTPTTRKDLASSPAQFCTIPPSATAEGAVSRGTEGAPLAWRYTSGDVQRLAFATALALHGMGIGAGDAAQVWLPNSLSSHCLGYLHGLPLLHAALYRTGMKDSASHARYLDMFQSTVIIGIPSHLLHVGTKLRERGYDLHGAGIKKLVCVQEPVHTAALEPSPISRELSSLYNAEVFGAWDCTELGAPCAECTHHQGFHIRPELAFVECLDTSGNPVTGPEQPGELVVTPLGAEAIPLLRYRTGDISTLHTGTCSCGRSSPRIGPILGRRSQSISVNDTTRYPLDLFNALDSCEYVRDYCIVMERGTSPRRVTVQAVTSPAHTSAIVEHLRCTTGITLPVLISNAATLAGLRKSGTPHARLVQV